MGFPRHPAHLSVHAGDRIVAVNGFAHDAQADLSRFGYGFCLKISLTRPWLTFAVSSCKAAASSSCESVDLRISASTFKMHQETLRAFSVAVNIGSS